MVGNYLVAQTKKKPINQIAYNDESKKQKKNRNENMFEWAPNAKYYRCIPIHKNAIPHEIFFVKNKRKRKKTQNMDGSV